MLEWSEKIDAETEIKLLSLEDISRLEALKKENEDLVSPNCFKVWLEEGSLKIGVIAQPRPRNQQD